MITRILTLAMLMVPVFLAAQVLPGAAHKEEYYPRLEGRRIGVLANQASVVSGKNVVEMLISDGHRVVAIFSPEHGFRVNAEAGREVGDSADSQSGLRVISLYGKRKRPLPEDLAGIDVVVADLQDVGVRFYTYISTLTYMMEACAGAGIPVILLDRPNPHAWYTDGPVLSDKFRSFVGLHKVPVVYGMTIGEYATMVNGEGWLGNKGMHCDLTVIRMTGFHRESFDGPVATPSPNLRTPNAINLYPSLCLFEGTRVSVGRGTDFPFEVYGHPGLTGLNFLFTPRAIPGVSDNPPFMGRQCRGVDLRGYYDQNPLEKGKLQLKWIIDAYERLKGDSTFFNDYFNLLAGDDKLMEQIVLGVPENEIRASWRPGLKKFAKIRKKYLFY